MSDYLIRELDALPNIDVRTRAQVVGGDRQRLPGDASCCATWTPARRRPRPAVLFVLIGSEPRTDWLGGALARDRWGFLLHRRRARRPTRARWPLDRPPALLETSMPGVFAAGDVRAGSVKRVASAVGEGALAVTLVHAHLAELTGARA